MQVSSYQAICACYSVEYELVLSFSRFVCSFIVVLKKRTTGDGFHTVPDFHFNARFLLF